MYSLDQSLHSAVCCCDLHANEASQQCQRLDWQLFFRVLPCPVGFTTVQTMCFKAAFGGGGTPVIGAVILKVEGGTAGMFPLFCSCLLEAQDRWNRSVLCVEEILSIQHENASFLTAHCVKIWTSFILKIQNYAAKAAALDHDCKAYAVCTVTKADPTTHEEDSWLASQILVQTNTEPTTADTSV